MALAAAWLAYRPSVDIHVGVQPHAPARVCWWVVPATVDTIRRPGIRGDVGADVAIIDDVIPVQKGSTQLIDLV